MDRRHALASGLALPDRATGAVLFADISGFTPLTQALAEELGRQRGPEEITRLLNGVYTPLIDAIHRYRGSVVGFAGDAITCWFDRDDGLRAATSALALQEIMQGLRTVVTPGGTQHILAIKVALVAGSVRRFVVGDPAVQLIDVLAGKTLDRVALGEHLASPGEVLAHRSLVGQAGRRLSVNQWRTDPASGEQFGIVDGLSAPSAPRPWPDLPPLRHDLTRPWVLPPVYERFAHGEPIFSAELRPCTPVFLKFSGIDYDEDAEAGSKLDAFIRWTQAVLTGYEGFLVQVTMGDKGSYLYAAFGSPIAHDDDPSRAVAAALRLRVPPLELRAIQGLQIGITTGLTRSGAYGADSCRTFGMQGNEVNMAARLMSHALPGQILVSQRIVERAARQYRFNSLGTIAVKGSSQPAPVAEVAGQLSAAAMVSAHLYDSPLLGRDALMAELTGRLRSAQAGHGCVIRLEGPAGIGKSHLAAAFCKRAVDLGWQVASGACHSTAQNTAFYPWRQVFRTLLDLQAEDIRAAYDEVDGAAEQRVLEATVETLLRSANTVDASLRSRLPLLGDLLGFPMADNAVTANLDPRLRQEAVFGLAVDVVQALSDRQPLLLALEDINWMDEVSVELTTAIARAIGDVPITLLLAHRSPLQPGSPPAPSVSALPWHSGVTLAELGPDSVAALTEHTLQSPAAPLVQTLIHVKSQGNPFFAEELVAALREAGSLELQPDGRWQLSAKILDQLRAAACLTRAEDEWALVPNARLADAALGIPDTIQELVVSRIDRLPEDNKLTLRVASVIGHTFELGLLQGTHPASPTLDDLERQLESIADRDFVERDASMVQPTYSFRHQTTHEVTYETLLFSQRRQLHRAVAEWYEATVSDAPVAELTADSRLAPHFPVLVHHWHRAEDFDRERVYAILAGDQAARQYANIQAITYLSRALALTDASDRESRYDLIKKRATLYGWQGQRTEQAQAVDELDALAREMQDGSKQAEAAWSRADLARVTGKYDAALASVQQAVIYAGQVGEMALLGKSQALWGRILWRQNRYAEAQTHLEEALALAQRQNDPRQSAETLYYLGNNSFYQDRYAEAKARFEQAFAIYDELSDRQGQINCLHMFGTLQYRLRDYLGGQGYLERALALSREVGWRMNEAYTLGNLGNVYHDLGAHDQAEVHHLQALTICREIGDREGEAASLDTLGLIKHCEGDSQEALSYHEQAAAIHREIGSLRGLGYALSHQGHTWLSLDNAAAAGDAYTQALALRQQLGEASLAVDDLAGLAEVALATGARGVARTHVEQVLAAMAQNGVTGIEFPVRAYLTCYRVLSDTTRQGDLVDLERAQQVLAQGYRHVEEEAARIPDEALRARFLRDVPGNRELIDAWTRLTREHPTPD